MVVYAYGRDGSRVLLPFVDDLHVDVGYELAVLMAAWQELRGADWSPDPAAAVLIGRRGPTYVANCGTRWEAGMWLPPQAP
ncbi:hypothetical protein [Streptomyces sp. NBC_00878]|uniref:hypothetical protein n=1 Tax=Streptomyces sp. NBC_00878 TaxID=2975854 RepID=UPI0022563C98|nr:hypothetical protein [Streptomyces sp. NBC_00878]MCX4904478.1 hypothetical protein [Streptomyces sp. NBC_00878]